MSNGARRGTPLSVKIGQTLVRRDVNENRLGGPQNVEVVKVGRKLITVVDKYGTAEVFRLEDGTRNDNYGHGYVQTSDQYEDEQARDAILKRLRAQGVDVQQIGNAAGKFSTNTLAHVLDIVESAASETVE